MASTPSYLIIVCAHAVFHGSDPTRAEHWALQSFQRAHGSKPSEHFIFIRHIEESMKILNNSPAGDNLIVFSGGATNPSYPYLSEAQGYMNVATWLLSRSSTLHSELLQQVITEEHATDTFQNILFSILKFYYIKQKYPSHVIVITHAFKSDRVELHRQAISWTRSFHINGIDPEFDTSEKDLVHTLERKNAYDHFLSDPYGIRGPLSSKRTARFWQDWHLNIIGAKQPEVVQRLLHWNGGKSGVEIFNELLPWHDNYQGHA